MSTRPVSPPRAQTQDSFDSSDDEKEGAPSPVVDSVCRIPPLAAPLDKSTKGVGFHALLSIFKRDNTDLDAVATRPSVFDDPNTLEAYRPPAIYENSHRFDPLARWTWREEKVCLT